MRSLKQAGRFGGLKRAANLAPEERTRQARRAALARWNGLKPSAFLTDLIAKLRGYDPNLARFVEIASRVPLKDQRMLFSALPNEKQEIIRTVAEQLSKAEQP